MTRPTFAVRLGEFAASGNPGAFPKIPRATVVHELLERQSTPSKINQGASSLCGAASLMYQLATHDFATYGHYVLDLYDTGKASLGKLVVEPGSDCRNYAPPADKIKAVDWIALASLRDSENDVFDYASVNDEAGGITLPGDLAGWFDKAGRGPATDNANLLMTASLSHLVQADRTRRGGRNVVLFINSGILSGPTKKASKGKGASVHPDHWVVLTSTIALGGWPMSTLDGKGTTIDGDDALLDSNLSFTIYTWGSETAAVQGVTARDFLKHYYGFVAVK
jgi:hypothetical protein